MVQSICQGNVPPEIRDLLEAAVGELAAARGIRHAIIGVEPGNGTYRWIGAAGIAEPGGPPMTPETPYCLASVTKLYIGAAILRLQELGRLSIDDPLISHLPAELISGLHWRHGRDRTAELTLRHLLAHASGLPEYLSEAPRGRKALLERVVEEGDLSWELADVVSMTRAVGRAHFVPRPFDGRRHTVRYSDTNFQLLMGVIEAVTGQSIDEAFAELLYQPLGLQRTWHPGTAAAAGMPAAASIWAGDQPLDCPLALRSFRDLFSTAAETLCFFRALIRGTLFDDPATARLMREHWNPLALSLVPTSPGWPIEYGLAMMRFQVPRLLRPFMSTPTLLGHSGASGSWLFYAPDPDLYVTGTVDQLTAPAVPYRQIPPLLQRLAAVAPGAAGSSRHGI